METIQVVIAIVCAIIGAIIGVAGFLKVRKDDSKTEGKQDGVILTELGYIKANTDEIKSEQKEQRKINSEVLSRLSAVESSVQQAHHRLDNIEYMKIDKEH